MPSRFTDTEIWNEDWYCEMPGEYQLLVKYVFDTCDNAGIWKPKKFDFEMKTKFKVSLDLLFKKMNGGGPQRVLLLDNGRWFVTGYILFQWFNKKKTFDLVLTNRLHKSLYDILLENKVDLSTVRGLKGVLKGPMVMVMDKVEKEDGVEEGKTETLAPVVRFTPHASINLPPNVLEAAELNQYTMTGKKNTQFIQAQWAVFKYERLNDQPMKYYGTMGEFTSHFLNWVRNKHPKKTENQTESVADKIRKARENA